MTGVSLRNTEQESNNLDRKREREKIIPQKENPRPNPGGKIAVRGRCFHRSPGDKVWGRKCKLGGKSGRSLRSRFREHAFGPGPKCTDYGSVFLNRAFIIIIIQPPLAINEKSPRYLSILIRSRHPARSPIIPSINLFEGKNRSWIGERRGGGCVLEREKGEKKGRKRTTFLFIDWPRVSILSTRRDTLKILLLFIGPSWFISRTPHASTSSVLCMSHFGWNAASRTE